MCIRDRTDAILDTKSNWCRTLTYRRNCLESQKTQLTNLAEMQARSAFLYVGMIKNYFCMSIFLKILCWMFTQLNDELHNRQCSNCCSCNACLFQQVSTVCHFYLCLNVEFAAVSDSDVSTMPGTDCLYHKSVVASVTLNGSNFTYVFITVFAMQCWDNLQSS